MTERFILRTTPNTLEKADTEDSDGVLTPFGMQVAQQYASAWKQGQRATSIERTHPELVGLFYDIRKDAELANMHALPIEKSETGAPQFVIPLEKALPVIDIGKKGGKIVGYSKGKPVYQGSSQARLLEQQRTPKAKEPVKKRDWKQHFRDKNYGSPMKWEGGELVATTMDDPKKLVGTQQDHVGADGKYTKERQAVHKGWIDSFFHDKKGNAIVPPAEDVQKVAIVMMGGPASGKTSTVKHLLNRPDDDFAALGFVNVNPDDVKEHIPEYNEAVGMSAKDAAWIAHEESSDVAGKVMQRALNEGMNLIVDGTGKNADKHKRTIQGLRGQGYHVRLVMPDVDLADARQRSIDRAEKSGRFVPIEEVLEPAHRKIPGNFEGIAREADEFFLFDTRGPFGTPPELKWSGGQGQDDVIPDDQWVKDFRTRGRELHAEEANRKMKKSDNPKPLSKGKKLAITTEQMLANVKNSTHTHSPHDEKHEGVGEDVDYFNLPNRHDS